MIKWINYFLIDNIYIWPQSLTRNYQPTKESSSLSATLPSSSADQELKSLLNHSQPSFTLLMSKPMPHSSMPSPRHSREKMSLISSDPSEEEAHLLPQPPLPLQLPTRESPPTSLLPRLPHHHLLPRKKRKIWTWETSSDD
jgi:hypothetical protein